MLTDLLLMTTDHAAAGFVQPHATLCRSIWPGSEGTLLSGDRGMLSLEIRGELEEALDALLLRAAFSETPILSIHELSPAW